jgi:orotate phosphoribosyltransferase
LVGGAGVAARLLAVAASVRPVPGYSSPGSDRSRLIAVLRRGMTIADGEPFRLSSGAVSSIAFDVADAICDQECAFVVSYLLSHVHVPFDAVGGPALGAAPLAYPAAALAGVHAFTVRPERKGHGVGGWFKGRFVPGDRVLAVEDVVTTGNSLLAAMHVIETEGGVLAGAATIIDRGEVTASRVAHDFGVPYFPLTTYDDFGIEPVTRATTPTLNRKRSERVNAARQVDPRSLGSASSS